MAAAVALLTMASCNDIVNYEEGYTALEDQANTGAPVITAVYAVGDTALATPITEAQMGDMIRIVGRNLNNPTSITFNTVEADLSEAYTYSTSANVVIPSELSFASENKIVYTTEQGSAEYAFTVPFPELQITGLQNEFINAGDSVTILGRNFDFFNFGTDSQVMLNGTALGVGSITNTSMKALIPEGTADNSTLEIVYNDENGQQQTTTLPFRPTQNLLYGDMSAVSISTSTNSTSGDFIVNIETDDAVAEASDLGRPHIHVTGQLSAWSWNQVDLSQNMVDIDGADIGLLNPDEWNNYVLKFEILTAGSNPLTGSSSLQPCFNWGNRYVWNPGDGLGLNTHDQWQTVTWPLADMLSNGMYGTEGSRWATLSIAFGPDAEYTADFRIGNIRIEHK